MLRILILICGCFALANSQKPHGSNNAAISDEEIWKTDGVLQQQHAEMQSKCNCANHRLLERIGTRSSRGDDKQYRQFSQQRPKNENYPPKIAETADHQVHLVDVYDANQYSSTTSFPQMKQIQGVENNIMIERSLIGSTPNTNAVASTMLAQTPVQSKSHDIFSQKLFTQFAGSNKNIVYSPLSLKALLAMIYTGANDRTASQLRYVLDIPMDKLMAAKLFRDLLRIHHNSRKDGTQLVMANKMYYNPILGSVYSQYNNFSINYFGADVEAIDFSNPNAVKNINDWISMKTNKRIQNFVSSSDVNSQTQSILVNAMYFKGRWATEFSVMDTIDSSFHINDNSFITVPMMYNDEVFPYAHVPEIGAKVLEMPYANLNVSMMIILPDDINGLPQVERRLATMNLNDLATKLHRETVTVRMPKFQIEYEVDMVQPLISIGITDLFTENADLRYIFQTNRPVSISKVQHKALINVNEAGSEAVASTYAKFVPLSLPVKQNTFTVDHPFMFAIRSPTSVFFVGHVVQL